MIIFLEQSERDRFAAYLEQEAASSEALAAKMREVIAGGPIGDKLVEHYRLEALAARLVAEKLRKIETVTT